MPVARGTAEPRAGQRGAAASRGSTARFEAGEHVAARTLSSERPPVSVYERACCATSPCVATDRTARDGMFFFFFFVWKL